MLGAEWRVVVKSSIKYPVRVSMPPALMKGADKTYIVAGCMIPVPHDTKKEDISKYVTYERHVHDIKTWKISSSSGSSYTVKCYDGERYTCSCPGFKFHKRCKHINKQKTAK